MKKILFIFLFLITPVFCFADKTFILIDKNDKVVSRAWLKGIYRNNQTGEVFEEITDNDKELAKKNLLNAPSREQVLKDGGKIIEVEDTDIWADDTYKDGVHKKDSILRKQKEDKDKKDKEDKQSAKNKLKALGLTDDEIEAFKK